MPQININEIDESIFTRVVTDDLVRVIVPGIASFGPVVQSDATDFANITFTDVNEWEKTFGYTEPEYNPFKCDVSRIYAKQLMQRGAAVTFIRINTGESSKLYEKTPGDTTGGIIPAINYSKNNFNEAEYTYSAVENTDNAPANWSTEYMYYWKEVTPATTPKTYIRNNDPEWNTAKVGSIYTRVPSATDKTTVYINNKGVFEALTGTSVYDFKVDYYEVGAQGRFCPQIDSIEAKYTGSFGNRLLVTFTPITSKNKGLAYQYSNVTVYRADVKIVSTKNSDDTITVSKRISAVHKLESHIVTTNPDDINYFGNKDLFQYIVINPTATAYDELSVIWSNTDVNPINGVTVYSGFPDIPLRYVQDGTSDYVSDALMTGGTDFILDDGTGTNTLMNILKQGFGGFDVSGSSTKTTASNINRWIWACYRPETGAVADLLTTLANCYENYTDPYIYDFDFITAGGFIDEVYTIKTPTGTVINTQEAAAAYMDDSTTTVTTVLVATSDRESSVVPNTRLDSIHRQMLNLATTRQDCICLIDTGVNWEPNLLPAYVELINSSYATVHAPWCYCSNPYATETLLMPPSFVFLYTMLSNLINNTEAQKWFPPAGVTRATARIVKKPKYEIGSVLLNSWQNNTLARVNPIMKLKNYGYVIYGQYTAYVAQDENTHSALESLNSRLISNCVKKQIFNTCLKLAFEPNNSSLWMRFYDAMDKYLLFMKRNDGLYGYRIQMDEGTVTTDDINELRCPGKVWINPTRTAEFFDIDFILTEAGAEFVDNTGEGE